MNEQEIVNRVVRWLDRRQYNVTCSEIIHKTLKEVKQQRGNKGR